ncbi:MAG: hypothetical protein K2M65_00195, partial [Muribaculaceae bacterium]|nr:hypothetical protein [Muribaculaceae bacterium]
MNLRHSIIISVASMMTLCGCDSNSYLEDLYTTPQAAFTTDKTEYAVLETVHFTNTGDGTSFTVWPGNTGHCFGVEGDTGFAAGSDGTFTFAYDEPGEYEAVWVASSINSDKQPVFSVARTKVVITDLNGGLENFVISNLYRMREYAGTVYFNSTGEQISVDSILCPIIWDAWRNAKVNSIQALQLIEFELTSSTATMSWFDKVNNELRPIRSGISTSRIVNFMEDGHPTVQKFVVKTSSGKEKSYYVAPVMIPTFTSFSINGVMGTIERDIAFYDRYNVIVKLPEGTPTSALVPEFTVMNDDPALIDNDNVIVTLDGFRQTSGSSIADLSAGSAVYII